MKKLKVIKNILYCLCFVTVLNSIMMPFISSVMQSYYKSKIDNFNLNHHQIENLLEKKHLWSQIGDTKAFIYIAVICVLFYIIVFLIIAVKEYFKNIDSYT